MNDTAALPRLGFLYLNQVLRFFDHSNFRGWPDRIESVTYRWGNDKKRFVDEVKRKGIDVLIGNIPATAYETFREIARELPNVRFIPSLDAQFANKSKENVTHFCTKHELPVPPTKIFYEPEDALAFLAKADYPKIIKKSYGPSNYGGYFVHKVDSFDEAKSLMAKKRYHPVYVQDFVPMVADIRVMLVGHRPVCAFWRRPPEGDWLTNTSQGGSMDYLDVPQEALDIAVAASRAANAEYWAVDIAVGNDNKLRILECATAFAAFPYVRDWIGQYLMWHLSEGQMRKPFIPHYNWEELGKIDSRLLRTMRHITFGEYRPSEDCGDVYRSVSGELYPLLPTELRVREEWPSEQWNFQDNYRRAVKAPTKPVKEEIKADAGLEEVTELRKEVAVREPHLTREQLHRFFDGVKGIGPKLSEQIIDTLGVEGTSDALMKDATRFMDIQNLKQKKYDAIIAHWSKFRSTL